MKKSEKKALKTVLDLSRRYVLARSLKGGRSASEEEAAAMETVSRIVGSDVDKQISTGSLDDVLKAMEKRNE